MNVLLCSRLWSAAYLCALSLFNRFAMVCPLPLKRLLRSEGLCPSSALALALGLCSPVGGLDDYCLGVAGSFSVSTVAWVACNQALQAVSINKERGVGFVELELTRTSDQSLINLLILKTLN
jgi:hypothetical protein